MTTCHLSELNNLSFHCAMIQFQSKIMDMSGKTYPNIFCKADKRYRFTNKKILQFSRNCCCGTRSKTSTFGLTYCQIEILQIKERWPAHLQHSTVQFSTSTFAVHYSTIQYQHICSTVLNIYSTFQVTCTFAAHYSTIQHQYICSTLQYNSVPAYLQHISGDLHICST